MTAVTAFASLSRAHAGVVPRVPIWQGLSAIAAAGGRVAGDAGPRYRAFISYSRRDAAFGKRLHRRLESYRLPGRLAGRVGPRGPVTTRLTPIFRDREDLPAADDISAQVRAALAASDNLIVVCSPAAKASPWVAREIETFRTLHPDRPVLAALVAGEPADAFPEALLRPGPDGAVREPLAADFRTAGDGSRLALLKLVAGVAGVGLDELVQRDAQRRVRRVTTVTAVALTAMLAMGAMTVVALNARAEADRQRREAEGLVEFMLTDLRTKLKEVGRLDAMTAVNKRAYRYYTDQDVAHLGDDSLARRARVLHAMGEDDEERGDFQRALSEFSDARRTTARLLVAKPADTQRIYDHAQSEYWVGLIEWRLGRLDDAQASLERYAALIRKLVAIDPRKPEWVSEAGDAESNIGVLQLRAKGNVVGAKTHFARALAYAQDAARLTPNDRDRQGDIADSWAWLADTARIARDHDTAFAARMNERAVLEQLIASDPKDMQPRYSLLGNELGFARLEMLAGQRAEADARLARALNQADTYHRYDPDSMALAKERRMIELFRVENGLDRADPRRDFVSALRITSNCERSAPDQAEPEIADFCSVLRARTLLAAGDAAGARTLIRKLDGRRTAWDQARYSTHWGIDFQGELHSLRQQEDKVS